MFANDIEVAWKAGLGFEAYFARGGKRTRILSHCRKARDIDLIAVPGQLSGNVGELHPRRTGDLTARRLAADIPFESSFRRECSAWVG